MSAENPYSSNRRSKMNIQPFQITPTKFGNKSPTADAAIATIVSSRITALETERAAAIASLQSAAADVVRAEVNGITSVAASTDVQACHDAATAIEILEAKIEFLRAALAELSSETYVTREQRVATLEDA